MRFGHARRERRGAIAKPRLQDERLRLHRLVSMCRRSWVAMNDLEPDDVDEFAHFFSLGPLAFEMELRRGTGAAFPCIRRRRRRLDVRIS
jgi:hypothetical protein